MNDSWKKKKKKIWYQNAISDTPTLGAMNNILPRFAVVSGQQFQTCAGKNKRVLRSVPFENWSPATLKGMAWLRIDTYLHCHPRGGPLTGGPKVWAPLLATAFLYVTPPNYRRTEHKSSTLIGEVWACRIEVLELMDRHCTQVNAESCTWNFWELGVGSTLEVSCCRAHKEWSYI